jgi:hypothetical protein
MQWQSAVRLPREAEEELRLAAQFYEKVQPGLGQALMDEVRRAKNLIAAQPLAARIERNEIQVRSIARFDQLASARAIIDNLSRTVSRARISH